MLAARFRRSRSSKIVDEGPLSERERIHRDVMRVVAEVADLPIDQIVEGATLQDLGIDSLTGLRIVAEMEKRYAINVPEEVIGGIRSIGDILRLVDHHAPGSE